jgi:predicted extracellular nuclease
MNKLLWGGLTLLVLLAGNARATINDLFISEYVEGSGYNKAIELYNGKGHTIDLSEYQMAFYLNGAIRPSFSIQLSGYLTSNTTYVVANTLASSEILIVADHTEDGIWFNGDDVVVITHKDKIIDSFGQVGINPGSAWGQGMLSSKNRTLRRVSTMTEGDADIFDKVDFSSQWKGFSENDFDGLGSFDIYGSSMDTSRNDTVKTTSTGCTPAKEEQLIC